MPMFMGIPIGFVGSHILCPSGGNRSLLSLNPFVSLLHPIATFSQFPSPFSMRAQSYFLHPDVQTVHFHLVYGFVSSRTLARQPFFSLNRFALFLAIGLELVVNDSQNILPSITLLRVTILTKYHAYIPILNLS